ncbi:transposase [Haloferula helveola]|uniref:Transposase n=1 Tax=Haloferula helveola TaxID=490095 RepID=A0ABM7RCL6_9BACT|nr:transposase [Haloferula helveola]
MPGTYTALHYHIVFATKDRSPLIHAELQPGLYDYIGGIARSLDAVLIEIGGMPDHVHLLVRLPPKTALADLMRVVKSRSSGWVSANHRHHLPFAWQEGYGAFAVSMSDIPKVRRYIQKQPEHHREATFRDEFQRFLDVHEISYDAKFL